jgi:nicotinate-nucleotide pyrophosphorylase (carboxylating)
MKPEKFKTHLLHRVAWSDLCQRHRRSLIRTALDEDTAGAGLKPSLRPPHRRDPTSELLTTNAKPAAAKPATVRLVARRECVVCGTRLVDEILTEYARAGFGDGSPFTVKILADDGTRVAQGGTIAELFGSPALLLPAERVLLNFLQRLTGIATLTAAYVAKLEGTNVRLLDTRKTTPGWRMLEKYAVATGGGWNHRLGLFDRIMLKDNHLAADNATNGERLAALVRRARKTFPDLAIECEVDTPEQIPPVLAAKADVILLDNFPLQAIPSALTQIGDRAWTEISGNITQEIISQIALLNPDFISTGALIHHAPWSDIALDF